MKKVVQIIKLSLFIILIGILAFINIKIHSGPDLQNQQDLNEDIIYQLNFLEYKIKQEFLAKKMQQIFPEGYCFTNALYGLTWCELAISNTDSLIQKRALSEARPIPFRAWWSARGYRSGSHAPGFAQDAHRHQICSEGNQCSGEQRFCR